MRSQSSTPTKVCPKCERELPATTEYFHARRELQGGLASHCRDCRNAANRVKKPAYRATHREETRAYNAAWHAAHREERRAYALAYAAAHPEAIFARRKAYRDKHRDEILASNRNRQAQLRNAPGHHTAADVRAQYIRQRGCCHWCGVKVGPHYHVDHVIPVARGGSNGPENIVIACAQCNQSKWAKMPSEFSDRLC